MTKYIAFVIVFFMGGWVFNNINPYAGFVVVFLDLWIFIRHMLNEIKK